MMPRVMAERIGHLAHAGTPSVARLVASAGGRRRVGTATRLTSVMNSFMRMEHRKSHAIHIGYLALFHSFDVMQPLGYCIFTG